MSRACYPHIGMVQTIWRTWWAGCYPQLPESDVLRSLIFEDRVARLGSYGDPCAIPFEVWAAIMMWVKGHVGYTHLWRSCDTRFQDILMASVDTPHERLQANALGWRTFRSRLEDEPVMSQGEKVCPAAPEGGKKTTCEKCRACDGLRGPNDKRSDRVVIAHGWEPATAAYRRARERLPVIPRAFMRT